MKTYVVTGGAGFIGSNYIRLLFEWYGDNVSVYNIDALTYAGNKASLSDLEKNEHYYFIHEDICNRENLQRYFENIQIDYIVNFAAESHVDRSIIGGEEFIRTNVMGTHSLLELAKEWDVKKYVQVSTDEVYGSLGDTGFFKENMPLLPNSPYSASKAGGDLLVRSYVETHHLPAVITRCSNNYGPYQFPEKLMPLMILNALSDCQLPVYGNGKNIRDWIHVTDHCRGVEAALREGLPGEIYNFGGASERKNMDVVKKILDLLKKPETLISYVEDRKGHDYRYAIDFSKAREKLRWEPIVSFESGLLETVEWYKKNTQWWEPLQQRRYQ